MPFVRIDEGGAGASFTPGESLGDILHKAGIMPPSPCGGGGVCGRCAVTVREGEIPAPTEQERQFFSPQALEEGVRLACTLFPASDLVLAPVKNRESDSLPDDGLSASLGTKSPEPPLRPSLRRRARRQAAALAKAADDTGKTEAGN